MITIDTIKAEVEKVKENRDKHLMDGKYGADLNVSDYIIVYDSLASKYSRDEIIDCIISYLGLNDINYSNLSEASKNYCKIFISTLFSLNDQHIASIGIFFQIYIKSLIKDKQHFVNNCLEFATLEYSFTRKVHEIETKGSIETKNDLQLVYNTSRVYADICEGLLSISLNLTIFCINILRNKKKVTV